MTARQILLSLILLLAGLAACGQELSVESFEMMDERVPGYMMVRDLNDRPAALVKVLIPIEGLDFEGDVLKVVSGTGEYSVYMPEGSKRLRVKAPGHYPRMVEFGEANASLVALKGACIYELRLRGASAQSKPKASANYVIFSISPADAQLRIDGKLYPVEAGGAARAYLAAGTHSYSVEAPGYAAAAGSFEISGARKTEVSVALKSRLVKVLLSCPTMGVRFYVNDSPTDGYEVALIPGMYRVEARRSGYATEARTLEVSEGRRMDFAFPALRRLTGSLNVDVSPIGAEIYVDGELSGRTPEVLGELTVGEHEVSVRAAGYAGLVRKVEIVEGTTSSLTGTLTKVQSAGRGKKIEMDLVVSTPKGMKIYPAGSSVDLGDDEVVEGLGVDMADGSYAVFMKGYLLQPTGRQSAIDSYGKQYLPTSEQLTKYFSDMGALDRTTEAMFGWKVPRGSYWNVNVVNNPEGSDKDETNYVVPVLYSGPRDEAALKSLRPDPMWYAGGVKVYDGELRRWGLVNSRSVQNRMKWRDMAVLGVYTEKGEVVGMQDADGELEPEERLMTRADADSINAHLTMINRSLRNAGGREIRTGVPYKIEGTGSTRLAYYFGEGGGLRTMKTGERAAVRPMVVGTMDFPGRLSPREFDLMTAHKGKYRFFSPRSWARLPKAVREEYPIVGVVVDGKDSWHVMGATSYDPSTIAVVPWFGKTLPSYEAERSIAEKFNEINAALGAYGLYRFDLNTPYWSNQEGKAVIYKPTGDGKVTREYVVPPNNEYKARQRQEVMIWPKNGTGAHVLKLRQPEQEGYVKIKNKSSGRESHVSEALWKHLPDAEKARWTYVGKK